MDVGVLTSQGLYGGFFVHVKQRVISLIPIFSRVYSIPKVGLS